MIDSCNLLKMQTALDEHYVAQYYLKTDNRLIHLNQHIGKTLTIQYQGYINCIHCGQKVKKAFNQGFCYPCFISVPEADQCIVRPELCQAHEGISRNMEWSKTHCLQPHFVYIANSGGIKVGVTRQSQVPTRWIDQGAIAAIKLAKTPNRHLAGVIEIFLKQTMADKTNWQRMLKNSFDNTIDLLAEKHRAIKKTETDFSEYIEPDNSITRIDYPVKHYPEKVKSFNLDKTPEITFELSGIKGQYLIGSQGEVFNVRRHNGYRVEIKI